MQWVHNPTGNDKIDWINFTKSHSKSNFFQSIEFKELYESNNYEVLTIIGKKETKIVASYNVLLLSESGPFRFLTKRAVAWGLPLYTELSYAQNILKEILLKFKDKFIYLEIRPLEPVPINFLEVIENLNFKIKQHYTIHNKISENSFSQFNAGRRKNIRRAEKNNLIFKEINQSDEIEQCSYLITKLYLKLKLPCPNKFFFQSTLKFENIKCFGLFLDQKLIATRFILCYQGILYDWYGTADDQGKKLYANDYMIDRIIHWGLTNNFSKFDFGGAGNLKENSGIREYKLKFGGELIEIGRIHYISKPVHYNLGKLGFSILKKLR